MDRGGAAALRVVDAIILMIVGVVLGLLPKSGTVRLIVQAFVGSGTSWCEER